jgi:hypothetical protein
MYNWPILLHSILNNLNPSKAGILAIDKFAGGLAKINNVILLTADNTKGNLSQWIVLPENILNYTGGDTLVGWLMLFGKWGYTTLLTVSTIFFAVRMTTAIFMYFSVGSSVIITSKLQAEQKSQDAKSDILSALMGMVLIWTGHIIMYSIVFVIWGAESARIVMWF